MPCALSLAAVASSAFSEMTSLESVSLGEHSMWITIGRTNAATANLCIFSSEINQKKLVEQGLKSTFYD